MLSINLPLLLVLNLTKQIMKENNESKFKKNIKKMSIYFKKIETHAKYWVSY